MKKLIATLFMAMLGFSFVAVAGPKYDLSSGTHDIAILEPVQYNSTTYQPSSTLTMTYTVKSSINRTLLELDLKEDEVTHKKNYYIDPETGKYATKLYGKNGQTKYDLAQVTFKTNQDTNLTLWKDVDTSPTGELRIDSKLNFKDYGIYFLDEDLNGEHTYYSLMNKSVNVEAGREFGVYYKADTTYEVVNPQFDPNNANNGGEVVLVDSTDQIYTTTENWVASYDGGNHSTTEAWFEDGVKATTSNAFLCLFQGPYYEGEPAYLEWEHFEFGFATADPVSGQPLPGTLATILISGLCAGALRKRNKK